jgi:hypothetical protein
MEWLGSIGATVCVPIGHSPDYDLVAEIDGELVRVQVKTSRNLNVNGRYEVCLTTSGGNQSWNRVVKRFDATRYDWLFVLVVDGRRWFIPSDAIEGTRCICLGGPKYAEFEVAAGRPFDHLVEVGR